MPENQQTYQHYSAAQDLLIGCNVATLIGALGQAAAQLYPLQTRRTDMRVALLSS